MPEEIDSGFLRYVGQGIKVRQSLGDELNETVELVAKSVTRTIACGGKILFVGNGGSASDSQHLAAELTGRFVTNRLPLPGIALTTDTSALTAIANDFGYESVFERQLSAIGSSRDLLFAISTSGNSKNIIRALERAKQMAHAFCGVNGCKRWNL